jgi:hypothetical protein
VGYKEIENKLMNDFMSLTKEEAILRANSRIAVTIENAVMFSSAQGL